jgi:HEPN domain-containing protein
MLEEEKYYINSIGNKCKCVKIENGKATVWVNVQIPPEQWFKLAGENGKLDTIKTMSAMIVQDVRYSHLYQEITDKNEIQRLSRIYERQHKGTDQDKLKSLHDKLEKTDEDLAQRKIKLLMRPFEAFDALSPGGGVLIAPSREDYFDEFEGPNLFKKISDWYEKRYGEEMYINPKIGEKPFRLRGHVYYFKYPVVYGTVEVNIFRCIENITPELANSLSSQELEHVKKEFETGYNAYNSIASLDNPGSFFKKEAKELIDRGLSDIHGCVTILKETKDSQLPIFIAQQAVEKFLKAFLVQSGIKNIKEVKTYSHRILDAFEECVKADTKLQTIRNQIERLNLKDMSIRYVKTGHTEDDAIDAIDSMLQACSFITDTWFSRPSRRTNEEEIRKAP